MNERVRSNSHQMQPKKEEDLRQATELLDDLTTSPVFFEYVRAKGVDTSDTSSDEYLREIHNFSKEFLNSIPDEEQTATHKLLELAAAAPYATRQSQLLKEHSFLSREEIRRAKDATIEFGAIMADYMSLNPDVSIDTLTDTLVQINTEHTQDNPEEAWSLIYSKVRGVRAEYAFGELMRQQDFLPVRRGSLEEDRRGIDFVATPPQGPELLIDIKASLDQIAEVNGGYINSQQIYSVDKRGRVRLFPLTTDAMFEGTSCRLKDDVREGMTFQILSALQKASDELSQ